MLYNTTVNCAIHFVISGHLIKWCHFMIQLYNGAIHFVIAEHLVQWCYLWWMALSDVLIMMRMLWMN